VALAATGNAEQLLSRFGFPKLAHFAQDFAGKRLSLAIEPEAAAENLRGSQSSLGGSGEPQEVEKKQAEGILPSACELELETGEQLGYEY
jgi:hypothetical protein